MGYPALARRRAFISLVSSPVSCGRRSICGRILIRPQRPDGLQYKNVSDAILAQPCAKLNSAAYHSAKTSYCCFWNMALSQEPKIKLVRIAHVCYIHSDMDTAHKFMSDFGLKVAERRDDRVFYKGYGRDPFVYCAIKGSEKSFAGAAFVVESLGDLERASKTLPKASGIEALDAPGGGKRVTFYDPVDGFPFHLVYGQDEAQPGKDYAELDYNYPQHKNRDVNRTQRFEAGPAMVHKLGHFGCCVTDFDRALTFYTTYFNLKPSDLVHDENDKNLTTFLHIDRGMQKVDHHTFFFFEGASVL